jgi:hypothetical protein
MSDEVREGQRRSEEVNGGQRRSEVRKGQRRSDKVRGGQLRSDEVRETIRVPHIYIPSSWVRDTVSSNRSGKIR